MGGAVGRGVLRGVRGGGHAFSTLSGEVRRLRMGMARGVPTSGEVRRLRMGVARGIPTGTVTVSGEGRRLMLIFGSGSALIA